MPYRVCSLVSAARCGPDGIGSGAMGKLVVAVELFGVLHRVKGTLCGKVQRFQCAFVAFAPFWLVLFWGFRGDTGAVSEEQTTDLSQ
jgi:hypothetical protein